MHGLRLALYVIIHLSGVTECEVSIDVVFVYCFSSSFTSSFFLLATKHERQLLSTVISFMPKTWSWLARCGCFNVDSSSSSCMYCSLVCLEKHDVNMDGSSHLLQGIEFENSVVWLRAQIQAFLRQLWALWRWSGTDLFMSRPLAAVCGLSHTDAHIHQKSVARYSLHGSESALRILGVDFCVSSLCRIRYWVREPAAHSWMWYRSFLWRECQFQSAHKFLI